MKVKVLRVTAQYTVLSVNGVVVFAKKGSLLFSVLAALKTHKQSVFTNHDVAVLIKRKPKDVANALNRLYRLRALARSPGVVVLCAQSSAGQYLYCSSNAGRTTPFLSYLKRHTSSDVFKIFEGLQGSKKVVSTVSIGQDLGELLNFERVGLLRSFWFRVAKFFYDPSSLSEDEARGRASGILQEIESERQNKVSSGKKFEETVFDFFNANHRRVRFKLVDVRKQVRKQLYKRLAIFDVVLYFELWISGRKVKYAPKLIVPIECKAGGKYVSAHVVDKLVMDSLEAWQDRVFPLVIAEHPLYSAFEESKIHPCAVLTTKQFAEVQYGR